MERQEYMELLTGQIRCKRAIPLVTKELEIHIEEQKADFMKEGATEQEAEEAAVREMGDPVEVGIWMDGIHRPKMNWRIIFFIGVISAACMGVWYYLNIQVAKEAADLSELFVRYLFYTAAGYAAMIGICYIDYTWFASRAKKIMLLYCGLLAGVLMSFEPVNDIFDEMCSSAVWLMAYLFIPLYCSVLYSYRKTGIRGIVKGIVWMLPIVISLLICGNKMELLIFLVVLAAILSYAVYAGTFQIPARKTLAVICGVTVLFFAGMLMLEDFGGYKGAATQSEYRKVMAQSKDTVQEVLLYSRAIGRAKESTGAVMGTFELAGVFPAEDGFTLLYLAVIFGTFVSAVAVLIIAALLLEMISLTVKQKNRLGRLMGIGCGLVLIVHAAGYVLENAGFIAPEQLYCPFTVGGREVIVTYVLLGVMLSIYRYQSISEA